jgi:NADPH:quinone reductase
MKTMKALRFEKYGPPSVLSIQELPVPDLKPGEVLVELHASAINPSDVKNVAGVFRASLPRIPGRDFAGVVVAGGDWKGKEVRGSGAGFGVWRDGTHAQYIAGQFGRALRETCGSFDGRGVHCRCSLSRRVVGPG